MRDGESGLLAEPGNAGDLAEKITRIWTDADLARRLGRDARRQVETEFSQQAHFDRLLHVYTDAIAHARGRPLPEPAGVSRAGVRG